MAITLCIETSGPHCSLALGLDEQVFLRQEMLHRSHNEHLLGLLDALFDEAQCSPKDVEVIGFGCGPGSFTGVRIAASATQAVAMAAQARVVPVSSSWVLAATAAREVDAKVLVTAIASRGQAYYLAAYRTDPDRTCEAQPAQDDELCEAVPAWLRDLQDAASVAVVGATPAWLSVDGEPGVSADLASAWQTVAAVPSAAVMVPWVRDQHRASQSVDAAHALPRYIAGDSPWRKRQQA